MFHWSNFNVMNECVYILCISEDGTNSPKEKGPLWIYVPYPKIYPILVPKLIIYFRISHFIILFLDVFHAEV